MITGRVYLVTCLPTGKIYVGQTSRTIERRWAGHIKKAKKFDKNYFHSAIRKYGPENFKIEELASYEAETKQELKKLLDEAEIYYIKKFDSFEKGYNLTLGGEGVLGFKYSEESKEKLRKINSGIGNPNFGKKTSQETIDKILASRKGYHHSEETRKKIGESQKGKKISAEQREKARLAMVGKKHTEETRQKMSFSMKGKKHNFTEESYQKIKKQEI